MLNSNVEELARRAGRKVDIQKQLCIGIVVTAKAVAMTISKKRRQQMADYWQILYMLGKGHLILDELWSQHLRLSHVVLFCIIMLMKYWSDLLSKFTVSATMLFVDNWARQAG